MKHMYYFGPFAGKFGGLEVEPIRMNHRTVVGATVRRNAARTDSTGPEAQIFSLPLLPAYPGYPRVRGKGSRSEAPRSLARAEGHP